jgi:Zn-dependent oligopeptidase
VCDHSIDDINNNSVVNDSALMSSMSVEQRLVATQLKLDAERHGIGLPDEDRHHLVELLATINDLSAQVPTPFDFIH